MHDEVMTPPVRDERARAVLEQCGLDTRELTLLAMVHEDVAAATEGLLDDFYGHVLAVGQLAAIVEAHTTVQQLRGSLGGYVRSLTAGTYDDARVDALRRIGEVHDRIDLPLSAFLAGQLRIDAVVVGLLAERFGAEPGLLGAAVMAYRKVVAVDTALVTQAFIDSRDRTVELVATIQDMAEGLAAAAQEAHASVADLDRLAGAIAAQARAAGTVAGERPSAV